MCGDSTIRISKLKDIATVISMLAFAVENFATDWLKSSQLSYIPAIISFIVIGINAYEDGDDCICKVSIIGISATIIIGIVKLDTVGFLPVGAVAITIAGLYFWKLERGSD